MKTPYLNGKFRKGAGQSVRYTNHFTSQSIAYQLPKKQQRKIEANISKKGEDTI